MITQTEYANRRKQLMQRIGSNGMVILVAAPIVHRNGDKEYPYRQQSDFYYLTGFTEPESVAILLPNHSAGEFILFNRPTDPQEERWTGKRIGQEQAYDCVGADFAYPIQTLSEKLPEFLLERQQIHYGIGVNPSFDNLLMDMINKTHGRRVPSPFTLIDLTKTVHEMRLFKSPAEIELMRCAATISSKAHILAMRSASPQKWEYQLEADIQYTFYQHGARSVAYPSIIGSGSNSCILHYTDNARLIEAGDIILIDAGCEYQYYASDVTRTFPVNKAFSAEQRAIYEIVLAAQQAGMDVIRTGTPIDHVQKAVVKSITQGLMDLGLLKGSLADLLESKAYLPFYMHGAGHWLGLDVHDVGQYTVNNSSRKFEPNMLLTVEPGLYISSDLSHIPEQWHNIGIRIEDDILVTPEGYEILSEQAPKKIDDIEAIRRDSITRDIF